MLVLRIIRINNCSNLSRKFRQMCSKNNFSNNQTKNVNEKEIETDSSIEVSEHTLKCNNYLLFIIKTFIFI